MTRKIFLLTILIASALSVFAQSVEVRRVTSQRVENRNAAQQGFEFSNLNSFPVTVEAELRMPNLPRADSSHISHFVIDTKTFVIDANEKYLWNVLLSASVSDPTRARAFNLNVNTYVVFRAFKCQ